MKKYTLLTAILLFLSATTGRIYAQFPSTRVYDGAKLAKVKAKQHSEEYAPAVARLMAEADKALGQRPVSVMDKKLVAASGDKHDYLSMGPYWWPDPSKPDGLPYIRKDGIRNHHADNDRNNLGRTIRNIQTLGIAYYFSGREEYAAKAAEFVRVWFIAPETRMNPNMNYAQMIPGHNDGKGRGFGMIDAYTFIEMLDAVELMDSSTSFTEADRKGLKEWFGEYLEWIRTSPTANEERTAKNNHGLAFDVQVTVYALFTGDSLLARKTIGEFAEKRLYPQIEPDGKQPLELARTSGFGYTNFNLVHMMDMCAVGKTLGIDLYPSTSKDGRSIAKALAYMASFVGKPLSDFPYQQIKNWDGEQQRSCWILRRASFYDQAAGWDEISAQHMKSDPADRSHLLYSRESVRETPPFPGTKSEWKGYDRYDFTYKDKRAIVVRPRKALEGNPWIWRPAFFGAFAYADEALLRQGFHIVFYDLTHQYGCPAAVEAGTEFYNHMTTAYGLSPKVTLEGLSRGGYYALQWAIAHPEKTACLYLDNPVCDMFSWPGRQRGKEWKEFLSLWQLPDDLTPERFDGNPTHRLQALAAHRVPILAVCGDSDQTVPFADNMKLVYDAYRKLGGPVQLIMKPGADHHPHSLENPEPIVDFIVSHQPAYRARQHCHVRGSLQNSLIRFEREKKGRVVFFGGSITHMKGWHNLIEEQLRRRFPATDFEFIEAGIPSAGTTPHAFRVENDVLSQGPVDLLFVEGAVNDHTNGFSARDQVRGMEGVVRHLLEANPYTDIIMLHFIYDPFLGMFPQGQTPDVILNHERVANHYLLPSIDCAQEISERIEAGEFTWDDFGGVHPKPFGHKFYAAAIQTLLDRMWASPAEGLTPQKHEIPAEQLDRYSYTRGKFVAIEQAVVKKGWTLVPAWKPKEQTGTREGFVNVPMLYTDRPGATFTYTFKGTAVGLFMACGPRSGILEYSIDHGAFRPLDTLTAWSRHLYLPWVYVLAAELDNSRQHTLTVRLATPKNGKREGAEAVIRNIVVSE